MSSSDDSSSDDEQTKSSSSKSLTSVIINDIGISGAANPRDHEVIQMVPMESEKGTGDCEISGYGMDRGCTLQTKDTIPSPQFKRQARLSRILQNDESSSDDDGELYTISSIRQNSIAQNEKVFPPMIRRVVAQTDAYDSVDSDFDEIVPMKILSKIVSADVLTSVKSQLKSVGADRKSRKSIAPLIESPAKLWELKKKQQNEKILLNKIHASKIKAGWKVRKCLADLPEGENVNTFFLTLVRRGMVREVEAFFSYLKICEGPRFDHFSKNYLNEDGKSALTVAIEIRDESMMRKLLEHKLDLGYSIFHAIEEDFMEGLRLILSYHPCTEFKIKEENHFFQIGMTPMLLAAHNNNYRILSLLYEYGHRLTELMDWSEGIQVAWESSNERRMICLAKSQPAYITLKTEVNRMNPMKYCLGEVKRLSTYASEEHEFSSFYKDLRNKYEDYMCSLLDFVCSSDELADLFEIDRPPSQNKRSAQIANFMDGTEGQRFRIGKRFRILEKASRENLVKFVTHQQSQLALSYLRFRSLPLLKNNFIALGIGLLFPFLSICYLIAPNTPIGGLITLPIVSFYCHVMSDIVFALILLLKVVLKNTEMDRLGEPLTTLEWLILLWILGKWVEEFQECLNRGYKAYFRDIWNYTDLGLLSLFSASLFIRLYDVFSNAKTGHISRYTWGSLEPRLIGEGLQAWGYVFVFLRLLGLTRVDRHLGPLQISLGKMLGDIVRFLFLFALVMGAFAFGLSDLYWYYGTREGSRMLCKSNGTSNDNSTVDCSSQTTAFTSIPTSLKDLFWALFGLFDLSTMSLQGKHAFTEYIGRTLVATYHVVAIIVMLNMLIAMMSKSYEDTHENEETAWKFHRTSVWIRYIRREVVRPSPMNLIPNPRKFGESFHRFTDFIRYRCSRSSNLTEDVYDGQGRRKRSPRKEDSQTRCDSTGCWRRSGVNRRSYSNRFDDSYDSDRASTLGRKHHRKQGFDPVVLSGVKTALRLNMKSKESKAILDKLVCRYKIKFLTKK